VLDFDSHSSITARLPDQNISATITFGRKNDPLDLSLKPSATKFIAEDQFCSKVFLSFAPSVHARSIRPMSEMIYSLRTLPKSNKFVASGAAEFGAAVNLVSFHLRIIRNAFRD
jgi:hypothetical protein